MKGGGDILPSSEAGAAAGTPTEASPAAAADAGLLGKGSYKVWALAAIILLALWSMFTGTVTLRWSAHDLNRLSRDLGPSSVHADLDILEMEEREKVVRHMWDVYAHSRRSRLPRFWQEAFEAAYEELAGDDPDARDAAVAEIARLSVQMVDVESSPRNPQTTEIERNPRVAVKSASSSSAEAQ